MHKAEIFSLIKLIQKTNITQLKEINLPEDFLPVIFFIMQSYYENKLCTLSNLSYSINIPFNTSKRKINNLINLKLIYAAKRIEGGKHNIFLPTPSLINIFEQYLVSIKSHIGKNFGITNNHLDNNQWFYGANYFKSKIIPKPEKINLKNSKMQSIKILIWRSSAYNFLLNQKKNLEKLTNLKIEFFPKAWSELKKEIILNVKNKNSKYDLVLFDQIWLRELIDKNSLLNLSEYILSDDFELSDFYYEGMHTAQHENNFYGVPLQITMNNLCYRKDIFLKHSLSNPENTHDLISSLKILHKPNKNQYGISFPGALGMHLGHFFCNLLGATFQTPLFNFPKIYKGYDIENYKKNELSTNIKNTNFSVGLEYLKELYQYSHPGTLNLTQGLQNVPFNNKEVCMAFIWSGMSGSIDLNNMHPLFKKISVEPFPTHTKTQDYLLPLGGFNIGMPSNVKNNKIKSIWSFLKFITSAEYLKKLHSLGGVCTPRYSLINDPEVIKQSLITKRISEYSQSHKLQNWMRPPMKNIESIYEILSIEIQKYLMNNISIKSVTDNLENKVNKVLRDDK